MSVLLGTSSDDGLHKVHEIILNGIRVKVNGRMDERHDIIRPVFDGRIKTGKEKFHRSYSVYKGI